MRTTLLLFSSVILWVQAAFAQQKPFLDCNREPNSIHSQQLNAQEYQTRLSTNSVAVYYVVPKDAAYSQSEYDAIRKASREIQAWFQINTGGVTYTFVLPDTVVVYNAQQNTSYYKEDWWSRLLPEMEQQGISVWQPGFVVSLWIKTGLENGIGLGAEWCDGYCGVAMAGVENFPEFNSFGICPDNPDGNMWPCIPHATMAHELGHAFGLPHPVDDPLTNPVANHSLMQTHWNYPQGIYEQDWPWGLLTVERTTLWNNPFFYQNISLRQTYDADVVNLPNTGLPPTIRVNYSVSGRTVTFTNNTTDAVLYYWTFGDLSVSNEQSPTHTYSKPGTYTVSLRASSSPGMTALYQTTIEIRDLIADKDKNKPKGTNIGPVKVYPNPNNTGLFYLSYPPVPFALRLTVLHPMGSVLFRKTISDTSQDHQLDLRSYGSGLYILRLEMKGATLTRQLIVN